MYVGHSGYTVYISYLFLALKIDVVDVVVVVVVVAGAYVELDQCSDDNSQFVVTEHSHIIFIGIRTHPMAKDKLGKSKMETDRK